MNNFALSPKELSNRCPSARRWREYPSGYGAYIFIIFSQPQRAAWFSLHVVGISPALIPTEPVMTVGTNDLQRMSGTPHLSEFRDNRRRKLFRVPKRASKLGNWMHAAQAAYLSRMNEMTGRIANSQSSRYGGGWLAVISQTPTPTP